MLLFNCNFLESLYQRASSLKKKVKGLLFCFAFIYYLMILSGFYELSFSYSLIYLSGSLHFGYLCQQAGFLNLGAIVILGQIVLCGGAVGAL